MCVFFFFVGNFGFSCIFWGGGCCMVFGVRQFFDGFGLASSSNTSSRCAMGDL